MQKDFMEDAAFEQDFSVLEFFFFYKSEHCVLRTM